METIQTIISNAEIAGVVLIPFISAFAQIFKQTFNMDNRFMPLVTLVLGLLVSGVILIPSGQGLSDAVIVGAIAGLGASGFYDNLKKPLGGK
ncbi:holin [Facklamia hominis]